jgi:hypothetical protein
MRSVSDAPLRTPTNSALMSPATAFGTREFASAIRYTSRTISPRDTSFTPGKIVPSWNMSTVSVAYGSLPPMSSQCALIAAYPMSSSSPRKIGITTAASCGCEPVPNGWL